MEECRGLPGLITIYHNLLFKDFVMIGMEYCPNGSLDNLVENRNGLLMDEEVKLLFFRY